MLITPLQNCLSTLSVIHNCAAHGCAVTRTRHIVQERRVTDLLDNELNHSLGPDDILLNLAQLHSARLVQPFQPSQRYPNMPGEALILHSIRNRHIVEGTKASGVDPRAGHLALNNPTSITQAPSVTLSEALQQPAQPGSPHHSPDPCPTTLHHSPESRPVVDQPAVPANEERAIPEPVVRGSRKRARAPAPTVREYKADLGPQRTRRHRG